MNQQMSQWEDFAARHSVGDVVSGHVVKIVPFGAFVEIEGVHGLLVEHDQPAEGATVSVRIAQIDHDKQRFSLTAV
ncbi:S1 RNA-binding domain-containing protein [Nonomuraea sp. NPDC050536]|uniref:S1 RNA-binding domain-containing protein n=1 Tax=Nonomuraea sp. NPDC050536 TaxID=3364366 RepID=UPI0037CC124F